MASERSIDRNQQPKRSWGRCRMKKARERRETKEFGIHRVMEAPRELDRRWRPVAGFTRQSAQHRIRNIARNLGRKRAERLRRAAAR